MNRWMLRRYLCLCFVCFVVAGAASAETSANGAVRGVIRDEQRGVLPGAIVIATSSGVPATFKAVSDAEGYYRLEDLPPGTYTLTAELQGFAKLMHDNIAIGLGVNLVLDLELKLESVSEAVVVTAQKRGEERLQDVPVPVTVVSAQELASRSQVRLREYFSSVPGLSLSPDSQGRQYAAIRGITTGRATIPTVSMMIDDVPYGYSRGGQGGFPDIDPSDLARIEVLRGPQGTLYGANSVGGLIKYVTVDPSFDGFHGRVELGSTSVYNADALGYNVRASTNVRLTDTLAIRAGGFKRQDPGYIDNPVLGTTAVNTVDTAGGLAAAFWRPSTTSSVKFTALYQDTHAGGLPEADVRPGLGDLQQATIALPGAGQNDRTIQAYSVVLGTRLGSAAVTSITGYNSNRFSDAFDGSGAFGPSAQTAFGVSDTPVYDNLVVSKWSQEIRVAVPLGRRVDGLFGAFYTHERLSQGQHVTAITPTGALVGTLLVTDDYVGTYGEYAAFANLTYHITNRFDVQVGGRLGNNTVANVRGMNIGPLVGGSAPIPAVESKETFTTFLVTPRFKGCGPSLVEIAVTA